jgi:hypothetical protein
MILRSDDFMRRIIADDDAITAPTGLTERNAFDARMAVSATIEVQARQPKRWP